MKSRSKKRDLARQKRKILVLLIILAITFTFFLYLTKTQTPPTGCFGNLNEKILSEEYDPTATIGEFENKLVSIPPLVETLAQILGETTEGKRINVDLKAQRVYAYEGERAVFEFVVSTGKWSPTPRGTFTIERKMRAQKMSGGNKVLGTYYYLPNVPWVMFFGNQQIPWSRGYSFHGTYWHNNFGQPMSHGCVNMKTPDAETLFKWAPEGTTVVIY